MNTSCQPARRNLLLAALSGLLLAAPSVTAQVADEVKATTDDLPTVDEILKRHIEAVGGEDAIRRHSHRTQTGTVEIPALEIEGKLRLLTAAPHFFLMEADLGKHGVNRTGYDGVIGWTTDELNGPVRLRKARLEELRRQADFHADLNFRRHYESIELLGISKFHEIESYELKMVDGNGKDVFAYFSVESGLQVGLKGVFESHEEPIPVETVMADYESFDGRLLPTRYETHFRDIVQHMKIENVSHALIDEEVFEVPPAVRALEEHGEQEQKDDEPESEEPVEEASNSRIH